MSSLKHVVPLCVRLCIPMYLCLCLIFFLCEGRRVCVSVCVYTSVSLCIQVCERVVSIYGGCLSVSVGAYVISTQTHVLECELEI